MDEQEKILECLQELKLLDYAVRRLQSDFDSEKLYRVEKNKEIHETLYDPDKGLLVRLDRLVQESIERRNLKQQITGLWISIIILIVAVILDHIFK